MYSPLPKQIEITKSLIHGNGLFAKEFISKETILGITHVAHDLFPDGWIRTPLGGFYNHAEQANCYIVPITLTDGTQTKQLITKIDIPINTELTCTYTIWKATPEMKKTTKKWTISNKYGHLRSRTIVKRTLNEKLD